MPVHLLALLETLDLHCGTPPAPKTLLLIQARTLLFATDLRVKPLLASSFAVSEANMNVLAADPSTDQETLDIAMANRENNEQALQNVNLLKVDRTMHQDVVKV